MIVHVFELVDVKVYFSKLDQIYENINLGLWPIIWNGGKSQYKEKN